MVPDYGGIGVANQGVAEWLAKQGLDVHVVCISPGGACGVHNANGVTVHAAAGCSVRRIGGLATRFHVSRVTAHVMGRADGVVICSDYAGPLVWKGFRQPLVTELHGCATLNAAATGTRLSPLHRWLERRTVAMADSIRAVSRYTGSVTLRLMGLNTAFRVVPNAVDLDVFPYRIGGEPSGGVVFVGKLSSLKGVHVLAEAVGDVFASVRGATLTFVGHDTNEGGSPVAQRLLASVGASHRDRVLFTGRLARDGVAARLRAADVFVLPSVVEAQPIAVLEAMASGAAVVASRRGGIPEVVADGVTGLLADPESPQTFSSAIRLLLEDHDLRRGLVVSARSQVEAAYAPHVVYTQLRMLYDGARQCRN